jgi:hypothetical protein
MRITRCSPGEPGGKTIGSALTGNEEPLVFLREAGHRNAPEVSSFEHLDDGVELPFAAVDQQEVGPMVELLFLAQLHFERSIVGVLEDARRVFFAGRIRIGA